MNKKSDLVVKIKNYIYLLFAFIIVQFIVIILYDNQLYVMLGLIIIFIIILIWGNKNINKGYNQLFKILQLYIEGYIDEQYLKKNISPLFFKIIESQISKVNTINRVDLVRKQAQYLALQNQINPHFLYNILESIRGEAIMEGMDNIASMTEALANFFRYTISSLDKLVTLEEELTIIETYFTIQKFRFGDKLNLSIEFDETEEDLLILNYKLPKLILQPIVENAIYHGIEKKIGIGTIRIKIKYSQKRLLILISDDGVGMEERRLHKINQNLLKNFFDNNDLLNSEKAEGIAISNVNKRIKLICGEEYGINVCSTLNIGTDVEIILPIIK